MLERLLASNFSYISLYQYRCLYWQFDSKDICLYPLALLWHVEMRLLVHVNN